MGRRFSRYNLTQGPSLIPHQQNNGFISIRINLSNSTSKTTHITPTPTHRHRRRHYLLPASPIILSSSSMSALIGPQTVLDPLLDLSSMRLHHAIKPNLAALLDAPEPSLVDLLGQVLIAPAGVVRRHPDERVVLVPRREIRVCLRLDGTEITRDEVDDA